MNPVSVDIKDKFETSGIGDFASKTGWGIFIAIEPEKLDTTITIYDTGIQAPSSDQSRTNPLRHDTIQFRTRGKKYEATWDKAKAIESAVIGYGRFRVGTVEYKGVFVTTDILFLEKTTRDRYIFVQSFRADRQDVTKGKE